MALAAVKFYPYPSGTFCNLCFTDDLTLSESQIQGHASLLYFLNLIS